MAFKYTGVLAKRRPYKALPGLLADDKEREAWIQCDVEDYMIRLRALYDAHGVEYGDESRLLRLMAETHVAGFQRASKPGRPEVWDAMTKAELRVAIEDYIAAGRKKGKRVSVPQACEAICKLEPWKSNLHLGRNPVQALRGQYNTAHPFWVKIVRDAREYQKIAAQFPPGTSSEEIARNLPDDFFHSNKSR
jgi:hypothetical protein